MHRMRAAPLPESDEVAQAAIEAAKVTESMDTGDAARDAATADAIAAADDAILAANQSLAYDCLHASRMIESAAVEVSCCQFRPHVSLLVGWACAAFALSLDLTLLGFWGDCRR